MERNGLCPGLMDKRITAVQTRADVTVPYGTQGKALACNSQPWVMEPQHRKLMNMTPQLFNSKTEPDTSVKHIV